MYRFGSAYKLMRFGTEPASPGEEFRPLKLSQTAAD